MRVSFKPFVPVIPGRNTSTAQVLLQPAQADQVHFASKQRILPSIALAAALFTPLVGCTDPKSQTLTDVFQPTYTTAQQLETIHTILRDSEAYNSTQVSALQKLDGLAVPVEKKIPLFLQALEHGRSMSDGQLDVMVTAKHGLLNIASQPGTSEGVSRQIFKVLALYPEVNYGTKYRVSTEPFSTEYREAQSELLKIIN